MFRSSLFIILVQIRGQAFSKERAVYKVTLSTTITCICRCGVYVVVHVYSINHDHIRDDNFCIQWP